MKNVGIFICGGLVILMLSSVMSVFAQQPAVRGGPYQLVYRGANSRPIVFDSQTADIWVVERVHQKPYRWTRVYRGPPVQNAIAAPAPPRGMRVVQ